MESESSCTLRLNIFVFSSLILVSISCGGKNSSDLNQRPFINFETIVKPTLLKAYGNSGEKRFCTGVFVRSNLVLTSARCIAGARLLSHVDLTPPFETSPAFSQKIHYTDSFFQLDSIQQIMDNHALVEFTENIASSEELVAPAVSLPPAGSVIFRLQPKFNLNDYESRQIFRVGSAVINSDGLQGIFFTTEETLQLSKTREMGSIVINQNNELIGLSDSTEPDSDGQIENTNLTNQKLSLFMQKRGFN